MNLQEQFVQYLLTKGYQFKTVQAKKSHLNYFLHWLDSNPLTVNQIALQNYYQHLFKSKPFVSTLQLNNYMLTVNQFYHWCCDYRYMNIHPFGSLTLRKPKRKSTRKPIQLSKIHALENACQTMEEKLVIVLGYGCGLRIAELTHLQVQHIYFEKGIVLIKHSKYNQSRSIPATYNLLATLKSYIVQEQLAPQDYLFKGKSSQSIRRTFKNLQNRLNIRPYYQLHQLRHSIASHLADNGVAIELLQQFLGHRHLKTTQNYVTLTKTVTR